VADKQIVSHLKEMAYELRKKLLLLSGGYDGFVHIGGDLSMADVFTALFHYGMHIDPEDIQMPGRDRFILSKGHAAICMYITMALRGFFDYDEIVRTYGKLDSAFGMHPCKVQLPGVESSTGSLGQGLAISTGLALAARQREQSHRIFCMMGDGETCEGEVWEAALTASSYSLGNLIGIVDRNRQFMTNFSEELILLEPYADKWRAFGWSVVELDGHDMEAIVDVIDALPPACSEKPTLLLCNTVKGKGVSFMERALGWHANTLTKDNMRIALDEVEAAWTEKGV